MRYRLTPKTQKIITAISICIIALIGVASLIYWIETISGNNPDTSAQISPKQIPTMIFSNQKETITSEYSSSDFEILYSDLLNSSHFKENFQGKSNIRIRKQEKDKPIIYNFETKDQDNNEIEVPILDLPPESDWLLIGPIEDYMLAQDVIAYDLYRQSGSYAPRVRFVKLHFGKSPSVDNLEGIFLLTERIKRDAQRLDIPKLQDDETKGSYILELSPSDENTDFSTYRGTSFMYRYPQEDDITAAQEQYIADHINNFEQALYSWEFKDPEKGYRKYLDVDACIDFIIFNELFANNDTFYSNTYMYTTPQDKIIFGPLWDVNSDIDDINFNDPWSHKGWYTINSQWAERLFRDEYFVRKFTERWRKLRSNYLSRQRIETTFKYYNSYLTNQNEIQGFSGNYQEWLINRAQWIDSNINYLSNKFAEDNLPLVTLTSIEGNITDTKETKAELSVFVLDKDQRKEVWEKGNYNNLSSYTDKSNRLFQSHISIKERGQSSKQFPKKQYNIETRDENNKQTDVALLDFPKESDWILYGPYSDKSLIRNILAYELSNQIGMYAPKTQLVELFMSNNSDASSQDYMGVYVLMEKIKRGERRVNISKIAKTNEPSSYILEMSDTAKKDLSENEVLYTDMSLSAKEEHQYVFIFTYPKEDMLTEANKTAIRDHINNFEKTLYRYEGKELYNKLEDYIDIDTFVDYYLLNEIFKNPDAFWASDFFYKDTNSKLKAGPIWDFNVAMGNIDFIDNNPTGWLIRYRKWAIRLMRNQYFRNRCFKRLNVLINTAFNENNINFIIDEYKNTLDQASKRNFERWNILGRYIWPNPEPIPGSYKQEVTDLQTWLNTRMKWLQKEIN